VVLVVLVVGGAEWRRVGGVSGYGWWEVTEVAMQVVAAAST
jgi:hypothetical protein